MADNSPSTAGHCLERLFADLAQGIYPPCDLCVETVPQPPGALAAVLGFTGHHVVAADVEAEWVSERCPPGDLLAPLSPWFLLALQARVGGHTDALDLVFCASALPGEPVLPLTVVEDLPINARVERAVRLRRDVRQFRTAGSEAVLTIGRGLAERWEASFEVSPEHRGRGLGRALAGAARHLVPPDEAVFMQVAPGNTASIRAVLGAGLTPVGSEMLFHAVPP